MHSINYYDEGDERERSEHSAIHISNKTSQNLPRSIEDFVLLVRMMNVRWGWGNFSLIVCLGPEQNI